MASYTQEEWISKVSEKHNNKYDYSLVNYIKSKIKVKIICPIHGVFEQIPSEHMVGKGCFKCAKESKNSNTEEFIKKAKKVHNDEYDYSLVTYTHNKAKVKIICKKHGIFEQTPNSHLLGRGCNECKNEYRRYTVDEFIDKANILHNFKYSYEKSIYTNYNSKLIVTCPTHGDFEVTPNNHIGGLVGCKFCNYDKFKLSIDDFISKANLLHNNLYDYSNVEYINSKTKVVITCPIHGDFEQTPNTHLQGKGCPKCRLKSQTILFNKLKDSFPDKLIIYECNSIDWLKPQRFDIYFPEYNIAIEYNGEQHYRPIDAFGGDIGFKNTIDRDDLKRRKCKENNCNLFEIKYDYSDLEYENLLTDLNNIFNN